MRCLGAIITKDTKVAILTVRLEPIKKIRTRKIKDPIAAHFEQSLAALARATQDAALLATARKIAAVIIAALRSGNKLLIVGNGGSAADAQHIAAEIVGRYKQDRPGYAAIALTTDTSALTAIANDYGFEQVFARQVEGLGQRGDVLLALSTSGRSPNILAALRAARGKRACHHRLHRQPKAKHWANFAIICSCRRATTRRWSSKSISPLRTASATRSSRP